MRKICTLLFCLLAMNYTISYAKQRQRMSMPAATEEWEILARKEFKKQRDTFLANDSSQYTLNDLGWINDIKTNALFPENKKHSFKLPFGVIFRKARFGISVEYSPCGESADTDEYWSEHAVAVHADLDSALIKVKRKAVARLFMRAAHTLLSEIGVDTINSTLDSNLYAEYMQQAEFDCISVNKDRKGKYIVYATLHVPRYQKEITETNEQIILNESVDDIIKNLNRSKAAFFATDSADLIVNDLGWVKTLISTANISSSSLPPIFRSVNNGEGFTVEVPCWEDDTLEYITSNVVIEHSQLDSALVLAKIKGVDDIYLRYVGDYGEYMHQAQFSCLCIYQTPNTYMVNATISIPNKKFESSKDRFRQYIEELYIK